MNVATVKSLALPKSIPQYTLPSPGVYLGNVFLSKLVNTSPPESMNSARYSCLNTFSGKVLLASSISSNCMNGVSYEEPV